jgi:hypothetical protein
VQLACPHLPPQFLVSFFESDASQQDFLSVFLADSALQQDFVAVDAQAKTAVGTKNIPTNKLKTNTFNNLYILQSYMY